jgi:hypothetical protein
MQAILPGRTALPQRPAGLTYEEFFDRLKHKLQFCPSTG